MFDVEAFQAGQPPARLGTDPESSLATQSVPLSPAELARDRALLGPPGRGERSQAVVAAIVTSDRGVLVTRRVDQDPPWGFTAGWGEPGESHEDTIIREVKDVPTIPERVVIFEDGGKKTFVELPAGKPKEPPKKTEVKLGISDGLNTEVVAGLSLGAKVLERPPKKLTSAVD